MPLDADAAAAVHDHCMPYFDRSGEPRPDRLVQIERCSTEGTWQDDWCRRESELIGQVTDWLRAREPSLAVPVSVSWSRPCAVRTTWEIFTQRWDDFCYAGSDDVFVLPDSRWLLAFSHEDWFSFCRTGQGL